MTRLTDTPLPTVKSVKALNAVEPDVVVVLTVTVFAFEVLELLAGETVVAVTVAGPPFNELGGDRVGADGGQRQSLLEGQRARGHEQAHREARARASGGREAALR